MSLAAPALLNEFHWSNKSMGLLLSLFFWTYGLCQLPAGLLIDRAGVRWSYALAFFIWSLASAAMAFAPNIQTMFGLRLMLGAAESVSPLASLALIRHLFPEEERGLPVSIYISGQTIGPAVGALLGTTLIASAGWRAMFAITGLAALAWLPVWLRFAPSEKIGRPEKRITQATSAALSHRWRPLLRCPALWAMSVCVFLLSYFWYFVLTWMPTYLAISRHYSIVTMGRIFSMPFFCMTIVNILFGWLADRNIASGRTAAGVRIAFGSAGLAGAAALALVLVIQSQSGLLLTMIISFSSFSIASSNFWALVQQIAPAELTARTIAGFNTISQVAGATAPLLSGFVLGPRRDFRLSVLIAAAAAGVGSCLLMAMGTARLASLRQLLETKDFRPAA